MPGGQRMVAGLIGLGWLSLAAPTLWVFLFGTWSAYSQGHELLLLAVAAWLLWRSAPDWLVLPAQAPRWPVKLALLLGLLAYAFGRSQEFIRIELLALWWTSLCLLWAARGWAGLKRTWFAWLFALFALPLPFSVVLTLTAPLKEAVSALATLLLGAVGYPVGRTGVVITVGQYQLLVAEACAGLHTMFVLEAMGLLYSHLMQHASTWRNALLALAAVPVAFVANVLRVMVLVVVTWHFGDAAGQGFVHHFAGVLLFGLALVLMAGVDAVLGLIWRDEPAAAVPVVKSTSEGASVDAVGPLMPLRRAQALGLLMLLTAALSAWWAPGPVPEADARARQPLESLFPEHFGPWRLHPVASALIRPAFEQARRFQMYDQVLERTYVNEAGQTVMLSVAYGRQQSVGLQMHLPQVCYRAGGFAVSEVTPGTLNLVGQALPVTRLLASMPGRPEPITYWRMLGDKVVSDDTRFKLDQIVAGLSRHGVADGLLVRLSSIDDDTQAAWQLHAAFAQDLAQALTPAQRLRVMGW
jgi:exosortase B